MNKRSIVIDSQKEEPNQREAFDPKLMNDNFFSVIKAYSCLSFKDINNFLFIFIRIKLFFATIIKKQIKGIL